MLFQKNVFWDIISQFNIFCASYDLMVKVFKPKYNNDLLSLTTRTWLSTPAQIFNSTSLPSCISASQHSYFSSSTFALKHPFLCLLSEFFLLQSVEVTLCPGTMSRPPCVMTMWCFKWSPLWSSALYLHMYSICTSSQMHADICIPHQIKKSDIMK